MIATKEEEHSIEMLPLGNYYSAFCLLGTLAYTLAFD